MSGFDSRRRLPAGAGADVVAAREDTVITNLYRASRSVGEVGNLIDCTAIAHTVTKDGRPDRHAEAYRLETSILDLALRQKACTGEDAVILAIVAAQRAMGLHDRVDEDDRPMCDAIIATLANLAGWILQGLGRGAVNRLPADLRIAALDYIDSYDFGHPTDPMEA